MLLCRSLAQNRGVQFSMTIPHMSRQMVFSLESSFVVALRADFAGENGFMRFFVPAPSVPSRISAVTTRNRAREDVVSCCFAVVFERTGIFELQGAFPA